MIYADNAATTKLDAETFEAMKPYMLEDFGNASQPYSFSRATKKALRDARLIIAECIGASPEEIYFTSGGTESDNWAIKGTILRSKDTKIIITSQIEHHAILNSCESLKRLGHTIVYLPVDKSGIIRPEYLEKVISRDTTLVSVMFANNEIGSIQPIKELANLAHKNGALFHTDAVQAVGHVRIDVNDLGIDMLSSSAHKFNGPKGIGFLYIRKGTPIQPYADGGAQESGLRAGTENVSAIYGMALALQKSISNMSVVNEKLRIMENIILESLKSADIDFIRNGRGDGLAGNISLSFKGMEGEMLLHRLDLMGICVSTGSACDSVNTQISHVLKALGIPQEYALGTIRVSLGGNNTLEEALQIAQSIIKIVKSQHE